VACLSVLLLLGAAMGVVAAMITAHRSAQSAADLSAIAGASAVGDGGDACDVAARIAAANGAGLDSCAVSGREVTVTVAVSGPRWLGQSGDLLAEARAGP
jgi:secretion/DNA translocation related TadE-like protein